MGLKTMLFFKSILATTSLFLLGGALFSLCPEARAQNQVYIHVGEAEIRKSLMALPAFQFFGGPQLTSKVQQAGLTLYNTVYNDLTVSSYFTFIDPKAFLEDPNKLGLKPAPGEPNGFNFENWKKIDSEFLVRAGFNLVDNQVVLEAYVYFVPQAKLVLGKKYSGSLGDVRKIAHTFANDIVTALTGRKGMFLSKIVVASDRSSKIINTSHAKKRTWKDIFILDWDAELGAHPESVEQVTNLRSITVSPSWSPDRKSILYSAYVYHKAYKSNNLDLFLYDLQTKKSQLVSGRRGNNSGAVFFPSGEEILVTLTDLGNPDLFRMNREGKNLKALTNGPAKAMNVEAAVSPDGRRIAFSSDRGGQPMIYIMDADGSNVRRVTFAGRYNASPAWSPDGKRIAFAGWDKNHFDIFLMDGNGLNLSRLTTAPKVSGRLSNNEDPTFSPDGRHIMFISDRTGKKQIYIVNLDGSNERRLTFDNFNYFKPKWSPAVD